VLRRRGIAAIQRVSTFESAIRKYSPRYISDVLNHEGSGFVEQRRFSFQTSRVREFYDGFTAECQRYVDELSTSYRTRRDDALDRHRDS